MASGKKGSTKDNDNLGERTTFIPEPRSKLTASFTSTSSHLLSGLKVFVEFGKLEIDGNGKEVLGKPTKRRIKNFKLCHSRYVNFLLPKEEGTYWVRLNPEKFDDYAIKKSLGYKEATVEGKVWKFYVRKPYLGNKEKV